MCTGLSQNVMSDVFRTLFHHVVIDVLSMYVQTPCFPRYVNYVFLEDVRFVLDTFYLYVHLGHSLPSTSLCSCLRWHPHALFIDDIVTFYQLRVCWRIGVSLS